MFFKVFLKQIRGYVKIRIEGYFTEKFINKCSKEGIVVWNVKREKSTIMYVNVCIRDFKKMKKIAKQTRCKINIVNKRGIPFLLNRYRKRKFFLILIFLIIVSLAILSQFIWNIEITGISKIDKQEIQEILEEKNLKIGGLKFNIDTQAIINEIRLKRSDISWIGIQINGTKAEVKIVEAESKPYVVNEEDYCNIVSDKTAQIVKISARTGIPRVSEGNIVSKGDILIAGWMEGKYTGTRYVHASGEIQAKVWYTKSAEVKFNQVVEEFTKAEETKYKIKFNNFQINFFKTLSKFEKYDTIETEKQIKIFSNFYLPINIIKITNKEKIEKKITYGIEEAKQIGVEIASKNIEEELTRRL